MLTSFTQLDAWKKAMDLAVQTQELTCSFPKEERYGIVSQMRRAAVSVSGNIAEGFGRYTFPDKKHKYVQARGELIEIMNYLYYCNRVRYIDETVLQKFLNNCEEVHKLLNGLISKMDSLDTSKRLPEVLSPKSRAGIAWDQHARHPR